MNIELYSVLLSLALMVLTAITLGSMIVYACSSQVRSRLHGLNYFFYIKTLGVLAIVSTLGALTYQFVYLTPVCTYCWWQRIFMFPIDIIVLVTVSYRIKHNEVIIGILAGIGALFAAYHYYYHVQVAILGKALSMPCSSLGIVPSCTETPVLIFGFITIPLMALVVFITIVWLSFLAHKSA